MPAVEETAKRDYVFIVNPNGANGRTGREWKKLMPKVNARLGKDWNVCEALTKGPSHAIDIAREAVRNGAAAVIAVGGDGTLHEVLNGFFEDGKPVQPREPPTGPRTALGLIPLGTGSDFARTFGWKVNDPLQAIDRLVQGERKMIDVGRAVLADDKVDRYFVNVADIHLSAKTGFFAAYYKKLGNLCYVVGALHAFTSHQNRDLKIRTDGGNWRVIPKVSAVCIGNAQYFGGGMKITPTANPFSGDLEMVILRDYKWYDFLLKLNKLYSGTHVYQKKVSSERVRTVEVEEAESRPGMRDVYVQADGEHLGFLKAAFSVLPGRIDFLV